jgi:transcriptional regulator with XRE-family HTH domain
MKSMERATVAYGRDLRAARRRAGLSQRDLAVFLGVTRQAVSLFERGLRRPRPTTLARIEAALRTLEGRG